MRAKHLEIEALEIVSLMIAQSMTQIEFMEFERLKKQLIEIRKLKGDKK